MSAKGNHRVVLEGDDDDPSTSLVEEVAMVTDLEALVYLLYHLVYLRDGQFGENEGEIVPYLHVRLNLSHCHLACSLFL